MDNLKLCKGMTLLAVLLSIYIMNIINPKISKQTFPSCENFFKCILSLIKESISSLGRKVLCQKTGGYNFE